MKKRGRLRFLGHPVHPVVTHFPMALLPVSLLGDLLGVWTDAPFWSDSVLSIIDLLPTACR